MKCKTQSTDLTPILAVHGFPGAVREYRFHPMRLWRFDYCWPARKLSLEIEGGVYAGGRHVRGRGYENDTEKYSTAAAMGWCVIRATPKQLNSGEAFAWLRMAWVS